MNTNLEIELSEAMMEPDELDAFVRKGLFREPEFKYKGISGTPDDPKFGYHMLEFRGPNWFGWIRITVIGKAFRDQASRWYTISVFVRRTDGPMFTAQNDRTETAVDLGKEFVYGKIKELPTPESLYPYLEAALDEERPRWESYMVEGKDDIDKIVYNVCMSIIHYLKGAKILSEAIDPEEFMSPVIAQGGFRPLRWKMYQGHIARGDENWSHDQWSMHVGSFDDKVFGNVSFSMDVGSPDDAKLNDGKVKCESQFGFSTGSLQQYRNQKAQHKWEVRRAGLAGEEPMVWIPPSHNEAYLTMMFRAKPEWADNIKKCFEICVKKDMRPLLDQRDEHGVPMLAQNNKALQAVFQAAFKNHWKEASGQLGESLIQEIEFGPEEMEQFGEVANDIYYASEWGKDNGSHQPFNRWLDVWHCELKLPTKDVLLEGRLTAYKGSEAPWLLHIHIATARYIIGYFHTEPTLRVLEKARVAALQQIKDYISGKKGIFRWGTGFGSSKRVVEQFATVIQIALKGDPEVYAFNYPERRQESITEADIDPSELWSDFVKYDGIQPWAEQGGVQGEDIEVHNNIGFNFKIGHCTGLISFFEFTYAAEQIQHIMLYICDNYSGETLKRDWSSDGRGRANGFRPFVPPDKLEDFKTACVEFVAKRFRRIVKAAETDGGSTVLPNYRGVIGIQFLNAIRPFAIVTEAIDPEEIGKAFASHGGTYLEWYPANGGQGIYLLNFRWLDNSHKGVIGIVPTPEIGADTYTAVFDLEPLDENGKPFDGDRKISHTSYIRLSSGKQMAQFQESMIEWAKLMIATFSKDSPMMAYADQVRFSRNQDQWIRDTFDKAANVAFYAKEAIEPGEFMSDFDINQVMSPWVFTQYEGESPSRACWHTKIEHQDKTRPFNDLVHIWVNLYKNYSLIQFSYSYRGGYAREQSPVHVNSSDSEAVMATLDALARRLLLPKIAANKSTPGGIKHFRQQLIAALNTVTGMSVGQADPTTTTTIPEHIEEAIQGLQFRSECRGAHNGQTDMTLFAELNDQAIGRIDYCVYDGEIHVQYIKVQPRYVRQGVATAMAKHLQSEYPKVEVEWGGTTELGTPFVASLDRTFEPDQEYAPLKKAYDDAKAERGALQAEFDAWTAAGRGTLPQEMLLKGERMNELETFLWDLEDKLRDMKPGRWMIPESVDANEFMQGFERASSTTGWSGPFNGMLNINQNHALGMTEFHSLMRPGDPNDDITIGRSYKISLWANRRDPETNLKTTHECPDMWIRLSNTPGAVRFQPGLVDDFRADFLEANKEAAPKGNLSNSPLVASIRMFKLVLGYLKKRKWQIDLDAIGKHWDLVGTSVGEAMEWSPDEIADIATKATSLTMVWQKIAAPPIAPDHGSYSMDWILHIQAPYGQLSEGNNYVRVRFYDPRPEDGVILVSLDLHLSSPVWSRHPISDYQEYTPYISYYAHVNFNRYFILLPGQEDDLRAAVESNVQAVLGPAIDKGKPKEFNIDRFDRALKTRFTKLQRQFTVPGKTWI